MKHSLAQKLAESVVSQSVAARRSAVATRSAVARFVRSGTAPRTRRSTLRFLASASLATALLLALPSAGSAQIGTRFPSEKKIIIDEVSGVPLTFLTSQPAGDSKIYQTHHHHQWTSDGQWLVFRSNRVPGQAMAVNEATGDLV